MEDIVSVYTNYCCGAVGDVVIVVGNGVMLWPLFCRWFDMYDDPDTKTSYYKFNGKYWDCKLRGDWVDCPNIF